MCYFHILKNWVNRINFENPREKKSTYGQITLNDVEYDLEFTSENPKDVADELSCENNILYIPPLTHVVQVK